MPGPLSTEAAIIAQLKSAMTAPFTVASHAAINALSPDELDRMSETWKFPLVVVEPQPADVYDISHTGSHIILPQVWQISVQERHSVSGLVTDYSLLDTAIEDVLRALLGWSIPSGRPMRFMSFGGVTAESGYVEASLVFTTYFHMSN